MKHRDLYSTVRDYAKSAVPMHMPGHKRNTALLGKDLPYDADITEIDGFDNLHAPEENGILTAISARAAALYRAVRAFPLVNGTTCGILAAVRALAERDSEILVARNCHKSVYHAVELTGLRHVSLLPPTDAGSGIYGGIRPTDVEAALKAHPRVRTVVVTSPTYEGVVSDVDAIAEVVHRHGARLIVDAAHGAHLGFSEDSPAFPRAADVAITSLHKTLPSLTQTALALVFSEEPIVAKRLGRELSVFETSSPSYVLLASIDRCISLLEFNAAALFEDYTRRLNAFYEKCAALRHLSLLSGDHSSHPDFFAFDRGKLVILTPQGALTGSVLADRLRHEFGIEPEMAYADYVLCMTSICDTDRSLDRLASALLAIDASIEDCAEETRRTAVVTALPEVQTTIAEAISLPTAALRIGEAARVYAWVYPPGVPLIVPGETVTSELLELISHLEESGLSVKICR